MTHSLKLAIMIALASITLSAQSQSHTYTGDIVNAKCMQAAKIVNRNSRGYVPGGVTAFTASRYKPLNTASMRGSILQHCPVNPGTTEFALVDDRGNFFKLDEPGNFEVLSQTDSGTRKIRVTIRGSVDGEILTVQSLSKQ
jgi:hypothetical protein